MPQARTAAAPALCARPHSAPPSGVPLVAPLLEVRMRNRLLEALPKDVTAGLQRHFERVTLPRGKVLHHPGDTIVHLHFPLNCLVSITVTMQEGKIAEAGAVGNREVVGINAFM